MIKLSSVIRLSSDLMFERVIRCYMNVGGWAEIPRSDVTLQDKLGEGAFGEVYKGLVRTGELVRAFKVNIFDEAFDWLTDFLS